MYIYIYHDSLRYKNLLANATHSCKFHVIGSEIIYMCVHTLFLHAVVHVDESSSVFSISSPGDFISFPHLFDHFIKRI